MYTFKALVTVADPGSVRGDPCAKRSRYREYSHRWYCCPPRQVYTLKALVTVADPGSELTWWWAALLVASMFLTSEVQSVSQHHCFTLCQRIGMKARACVCVAVFQKVGLARTRCWR